MDLITILIQLICLIAIGGIVWWIINLVPLPQPIRIVICVIVALIAIVVLADIAGFGGHHLLIH